jgi:hypothetical protein
MEKSYKENEMMFGASDIARLIVDSPSELKHLEFGSDGVYKAYIVDENTEIPSHYEKKLEVESWAHVYDDRGLVAKFAANKIIFYRAGEFSVIVQLIGKR